MTTSFLQRSIESVSGTCNLFLTTCIAFIMFIVIAPHTPAFAQPVLFDFDSVPIHSNLPFSETIGGITARFSGTAGGYSIQDANVLGFTPQGFSGHVIYPNTIFLADLLISYDQTLTDFSIMYSVDELACDTSATMRVTAFMNGNFVGTNTMVARHPGTWPVDTLSCSFPQGFDSVVVHYDSHAPTCQDYGVIFMADNMWVTPFNVAGVSEDNYPELFMLRQNYPNPFNPGTTIGYWLQTRSNVTLKVFDVLGREVATLVNGVEPQGNHSVMLNGNNLVSGVYYYRLQSGNFNKTKKLLLIR
jgi:type IX secretion system substrate protein